MPPSTLLIGGQARLFDRMGMPWAWNPTTGEILADRRDGCGDGAYMWKRDGNGFACVANPEADRAIEKRQPRWNHEMERIEALGRAIRAIARQSDTSDAPVNDAVGATSGRSRGSTRQHEATLLAAGYAITSTKRVNGRPDLRIVSPDRRRTFRSKLEALRHLAGKQ